MSLKQGRKLRGGYGFISYHTILRLLWVWNKPSVVRARLTGEPEPILICSILLVWYFFQKWCPAHIREDQATSGAPYRMSTSYGDIPALFEMVIVPGTDNAMECTKAVGTIGALLITPAPCWTMIMSVGALTRRKADPICTGLCRARLFASQSRSEGDGACCDSSA